MSSAKLRCGSLKNLPVSWASCPCRWMERSYGAVRAELEACGRVIGNNDLWIAAHARAAKLILVTNNEREFQRVSGLEVQNWAKSEGPTSRTP